MARPWPGACARLAGRAWTSEGGDLWEALAYLDAAGCARYVLTDVYKGAFTIAEAFDVAGRA
ncbi:MAG: hypothetical protein Q4G51_01025 [Dermatophilus congolensis]|nr:hypothetical protein [Dermatophilus congolensis]